MRYMSLVWLLLIPVLLTCSGPGEKVSKTSGVFITPEMMKRARQNIDRYEWAKDIKNDIVSRARPWLALSDDELWDMMFGNTISRSWMVWSDGYCPACGESVPMYTWEIDAFESPWKVRCPHCGQQFPTNDFHAFYRSGLDEHGVFDPSMADRKLLYNTDHPDPADSLHFWGVDDGEGFIDGDRRWRFIGAYLVYGQWKQCIVNGITNCADAYVVSGDLEYAHKAAVLLDRVADLYPTHDFAKQGVVYERQGNAGYVSTWHDACEETREMILAYDKVFNAVQRDDKLVNFLSGKAEKYKLDNPKKRFADIQRNIEQGIIQDPIQNRHKIESNYPRTDITLIYAHAIAGWPDNRNKVMAMTDSMITYATSVDGVTGEKGLAGYSAGVIQSLADFLESGARVDPNFLGDVMSRCPHLKDTYRFFTDLWVDRHYYPLIGDTGFFAGRFDRYAGVHFDESPGLKPSMYSFLWHLYRETGDPSYVQILYFANGNTVDKLPHDLFNKNPSNFQKDVSAVIEDVGTQLPNGSVNKTEWAVALHRCGFPDKRWTFWLDYDSGGRHSHADAMNLGLYGYGLDLMPDFGYPPVQYGGWTAPRALWYMKTAAHNTVVIDGRDQDKPWSSTRAGTTTLWADGKLVHGIRASAPRVYDVGRYERTVFGITTPDNGIYLLDVFRVSGGNKHTKHFHSYFGTISTGGLDPEPGGDFDEGVIMRAPRTDNSPLPGWFVEWKVQDRYSYLDTYRDIRLRYTGLTDSTSVMLAEDWVTTGLYNEDAEAWIPSIAITRSAVDTLTSTFASVIEPYEHTRTLSRIRGIPVIDPSGKPCPGTCVCVEVTMRDGSRDIIFTADPEHIDGSSLTCPEIGCSFNGDWGMVRISPEGAVEYFAAYGVTHMAAGKFAVELSGVSSLFECSFDAQQTIVERGNTATLKSIVTSDGEQAYP